MENKTRKLSQHAALTIDDLILIRDMVDNAAALIGDLADEYFTAVNPRDGQGSREYIIGRYEVAKAEAVGVQLMLLNVQRQIDALSESGRGQHDEPQD